MKMDKISVYIYVNVLDKYTLGCIWFPHFMAHLNSPCSVAVNVGY